MMMMNNDAQRPLVSIVTGCYNGAAFLEQYFESVSRQTWRPLEAVIVDDGSTDGSSELLDQFAERYAEPGLTFRVIHQENNGVGHAVNTAYQHATGKYLLCFDIDDYCLPRCIEAQASFLESNPDYSCVRINGYRVAEDDMDNESVKFTDGEVSEFDGDTFMELVFGNTYNWPGSYCVRMSELDRIYPERVFTHFRHGQNMHLLMPVCYKAKTGFIDECLMKYIKHPSSICNADKSCEKDLFLNGKFKEIRLEILSSMGLLTDDLSKAIEKRFANIALNIAFSYNNAGSFDAYYDQLKANGWLSLGNRLNYHKIHNNKVMVLLLRLARKFLHLSNR